MRYDEKWLNAFVAHHKRDEILEAAGIGKFKYYKLRDDPEFMRLVARKRGDIVRSCVQKMESYLNDDVEILQGIITSEETKPQIRLNGIQILLTQFVNYKELVDILERIENLERMAKEQQ